MSHEKRDRMLFDLGMMLGLLRKYTNAEIEELLAEGDNLTPSNRRLAQVMAEIVRDGNNKLDKGADDVT